MGNNFAPGRHPPKLTPFTAGAAINPDSTPANNREYLEMVGTLLFASTNTRPDIAYAVNIESRFLDKPTKAHATFARNTISYAAATSKHGLLYKSMAPATSNSKYIATHPSHPTNISANHALDGS
jgi:hypothetical protein